MKAKGIIDKNHVLILDVRSVKEFDYEHIKNANIIPLQYLNLVIKDIPRNKIILVYSGNDNRHILASEILVQNGFKNVNNINGGLAAWTRAGLETTSMIDNFP